MQLVPNPLSGRRREKVFGSEGLEQCMSTMTTRLVQASLSGCTQLWYPIAESHIRSQLLSIREGYCLCRARKTREDEVELGMWTMWSDIAWKSFTFFGRNPSRETHWGRFCLPGQSSPFESNSYQLGKFCTICYRTARFNCLFFLCNPPILCALWNWRSVCIQL